MLSEHLDKMPFKIDESAQTDFRGDVFDFILNVTSINIPAKKCMSFKELVDVMPAFKHTNDLHFTLYKIIALTSYIDRINTRISTEAGFGKDSVVSIIQELVDSTVNIYGATFAKLEFSLINKLIVLNEMGNLKPEEKMQMQEFLLATGAYFNTYTKRTRKCYDEKTRVLTKEGFKYHNEVKKDEEIMVINPKNREITWSKPKGLFQTNVYNEDMIHFKSSSGIDMCVTPEHKIWYTTNTNGNWKEGKAKDVFNYKRRVIFDNSVNNISNEITIPKIETKKVEKTTWKDTNNDEMVLDTPLFLELLGWIISEGTIDKDGNRVRISQQEGVNANRIEELIKLLKFKYYKYISKNNRKKSYKNIVHFQLRNKWLNSWLKKHVGTKFDNKRIPDFIRNMNNINLKIIFDSLMLGDGHKHKKGTGMTYYSKSYKLCENVLEIAMKLGYNAHISNRKSFSAYKVMISKRINKNLDIKENIKKIKYTGKIYCFETETGYYVTERMGCLSFQGNTSTTQEQYNISNLSLLIFYNLPDYYINKAQE